MGINQDISTSDIFSLKIFWHREKNSVKHCRFEEMISDFLTKPLQGSLFKRMKSIIMGHAPFPTEERVGKYITVKQLTNRHKIKRRNISRKF